MQPDLILIPFGKNATAGTIEPIPDTAGPGDGPQKATWNYGFPQVTMTPLGAGGIPPQGQDINGVLNAISEHTVFNGHGGQYKWSTAYVTASGGYSIGDVIQADDGLNSYVSLVNTNTANFNTTPASIGVSWELYAGRKTQTQATETVKGIAEIATTAEVTAGADDSRIVTPLKLQQRLSAVVVSATETASGIAEIATQAEVAAGVDDARIVTPKKLMATQATTALSGLSRFGTPAEQVAGILATVASNPAGVLALITAMFPKRSFAAKDFIRIPDVTDGFIFQWGPISSAASAAKSETLQVSCPVAHLAVVLTGLQVTGATQAYATLNSKALGSFTWTGFAAPSGTAPSITASVGQVQGFYFSVGF